MPVEELTERTAAPAGPELIPQPNPQAPEPTPTPFLPPGQLPPAHPSERPAWAKKGGPEVVQPLPDQSLKDKGKKTRRAVRDREDEPLPLRDDAARWRDLRAMPMHRREEKSRHATPGATTEVTKPRLKAVKLAEGLTVKDFAEAVGQKPSDVIKKLMEMDMLVALNQPIASEAASLLAESFGVRIEMTAERPTEELLVEEAAEVEAPPVARPPVVTIMGHVDHGKTSLLDAIRETRVTEGEAGRRTRANGAEVLAKRRDLMTFLDTPGHEAFTAMRSRGAKVTDIVVLVVAADDGVMPQTIEAVDHARAAEVPIIVAINKIDKHEANQEKVKQELVAQAVVPEEWGGDTVFAPVSAKTHEGIPHLLEMLLLQSDILELKANPNKLARGTIVEAKLDRGRGPVAAVLVQEGTLRVGDAFVCGVYYGK